MKKVFASVDNDISVGVRKSFVYPDCLTLIISDKGRDEAQTAVLPNRDIPSLMLALGEAAGIVPKVPSQYLYGTLEHLTLIQWHLAKHVKGQAAIAAAQAEQNSKLEAKAVELYEVHREIMDYEACMWELLDDVNKRYWLALARKARELGN